MYGELRGYYQFAKTSSILYLGEALVFDPLAENKLDLAVSRGRVQQTKRSPKLLASSISYLKYSSA